MLGISSSWYAAQGKTVYESVKAANGLGFRLVELGAAHRFEERVFDTVKQVKHDFPDMLFTVHSYFPPIFREPVMINICKGLTLENRKAFDSLFKAASIVRAEVVSMHSGTLTDYEACGEDKQMKGMIAFRQTKGIEHDLGLKNACSSLQYCLRLAGDYGIKLCIENLPNPKTVLLSKVEDFSSMLEQFPRLGLLIDVGHSPSLFSDPYWFECFKDRIFEMHIHDFSRAKGLDHQVVGSGDLDFKRIFSSEVIRRIPLILEHSAMVSEPELLEERELLKKRYSIT